MQSRLRVAREKMQDKKPRPTVGDEFLEKMIQWKTKVAKKERKRVNRRGGETLEREEAFREGELEKEEMHAT